MMSTTDAASSTLPEQLDRSLHIAERAERDGVQRLRALFNQLMRVTIRDGRVFLGTFAGTDRLLNILLLNADEYRYAPPQHANPHGRFVGLVLIPWRLVCKAEAHRPRRPAEVDVYPGVGLKGIVETYEDAEDELYT